MEYEEVSTSPGLLSIAQKEPLRRKQALSLHDGPPRSCCAAREKAVERSAFSKHFRKHLVNSSKDGIEDFIAWRKQSLAEAAAYAAAIAEVYYDAIGSVTSSGGLIVTVDDASRNGLSWSHLVVASNANKPAFRKANGYISRTGKRTGNNLADYSYRKKLTPGRLSGCPELTTRFGPPFVRMRKGPPLISAHPFVEWIR